MKTLVIIRHAKAEKLQEDMFDFDRILNKKGKKTAYFMAQKLLLMKVVPDLIISSPVIRALNTAEIIAGVFTMKDEIATKGFLYNRLYNLVDLVEEIICEKNDANTVFVVGHNPSLMAVIKQIEEEDPFYLHTSSAIAFNFDCNNWLDITNKKGEQLFRINQD